MGDSLRDTFWKRGFRGEAQPTVGSPQSAVGNQHLISWAIHYGITFGQGVSGVRRSFQSAVGSPQFVVRNLQGVSGVVALCSWQSAVGKPFGHGGFKGEAQYSENHFGQRGFRGEAQPNP